MDPYVEIRSNLERIKTAIRDQSNIPLAQRRFSNYIKDLGELTRICLQDLQASDSDCMDSVGVHLTSPAVPMTVVGIDCLEEFLQEAQGSLQSNITGRGSPDTQSKGLSDKNQSTTSSEKSHKILKLPKAAVAKSVEHATKKYGPKIVHRPMTPCKSERGIKQKHIVNRGKRRCKSVNTIVTVDESINKDVSTLKGKRDIKGYSSDFFDVLCRPISYFRHCDGHGTITSPSLEVAGFICSGLDSVSTCSSSSLQKINFSDQTNNSVTQQRVDMTPVDNPTNSTIRNDVTAGVKSSPFKRNLNLSPIEHDNATSDLYCEEPKRKVRGHLTGKTKHTTANQSCGIKRVCDESKVIIAEKFSTLPKNDIAVDLHNTAKATNHIDPAVGINTRIRCLKTDGPTAVKTACTNLVNIQGVLIVMKNITSFFDSSAKQRTFRTESPLEMRTYVKFSSRWLLSSMISRDQIVIKKARGSHRPTVNDLEEVIRWYEKCEHAL